MKEAIADSKNKGRANTKMFKLAEKLGLPKRGSKEWVQMVLQDAEAYIEARKEAEIEILE